MSFLNKLLSLAERVRLFFANKISFVFSLLREEKLELAPVIRLFETYIGVFVVGFESFDGRVPNIGTFVDSMMVTDVIGDGNSVYLTLAKSSGAYGGHIKLCLTKNGQFSEIDDANTPSLLSRYRIYFYGGDCIEYSDTDNKCNVSYGTEHVRIARL